MKTAFIVSTIKNLNHDYEHLQWLRLFYLNNNYRLSEDWISQTLNIRNNKPYFKPAPNFDYMKVATNSIREADQLIFLMSSSSTFMLTLLRYALHLNRDVIVICPSPSVIKKLEKGKEHLVTVLKLSDYQKRLRELI